MHRIPKHDTTQLIPSDGFNEKVTINKMELKNPVVHRIKERPILSMIHKYNIAELALVDRPVKGPDAGFGSIVQKHHIGHDKAYFQTA